MLAGVVLGLRWILATGTSWGRLQAALFLIYLEVDVHIGQTYNISRLGCLLEEPK